MGKKKSKKNKKPPVAKKTSQGQSYKTNDFSELNKHISINQSGSNSRANNIGSGSSQKTGNEDISQIIKPGSANKPGTQGPHRPPPGPGKKKPSPLPRKPSHPTNAGHYYYVKGEGPGRDFGRRMDTFSIWQLLGTPEKPLDAIRIHGVPYHDYFRSPAATNSFDLTTTYPGLLVGTGYMHPVAEKNENDFQAGFHFDWSTGLPVIPGSTVKGVLRSVFPKPKDSPDATRQKQDYLTGTLAEVTKQEIPDPAGFVENLETMLFLGFGAAYFDAYISDIPRDPAHKGRIFSEDYITPHKDRFSDPIPLRFLKISPEVSFRFQFRLAPIEPAGVPVKPGHIKDFFKTILSDFGVGAKRNTGFGALMEATG
jgi:CRISPR-associated protein Cmr6